MLFMVRVGEVRVNIIITYAMLVPKSPIIHTFFFILTEKLTYLFAFSCDICFLFILLHCGISLLWYVFILFSNWGDEDKEDQQYHNGNSEPRGFGKKNPLLIYVCMGARYIKKKKHIATSKAKYIETIDTVVGKSESWVQTLSVYSIQSTSAELKIVMVYISINQLEIYIYGIFFYVIFQATLVL